MLRLIDYMAATAPPIELQKYIRSLSASGNSHEVIADNLRDAGWDEGAISNAFEYLFAPITSDAIGAVTDDAPTASLALTRADYPMTTLSYFKSAIIVTVMILMLFVLSLYVLELLLVLPILLLHDPYVRGAFRYEVHGDGVYAFHGKTYEKARHRHFAPFAEIRSIELKQDLFDALFDIATLVIDFKKGEEKKETSRIVRALLHTDSISCPTQFGTLVTSKGCPMIRIPGLKRHRAEQLADILRSRLPHNKLETLPESLVNKT